MLLTFNSSPDTSGQGQRRFTEPVENPKSRCDTENVVYNGKSFEQTISWDVAFPTTLFGASQRSQINYMPTMFLVSTFSGIHLKMNVSPQIGCPVWSCFASVNRGSCFVQFAILVQCGESQPDDVFSHPSLLYRGLFVFVSCCCFCFLLAISLVTYGMFGFIIVF